MSLYRKKFPRLYVVLESGHPNSGDAIRIFHEVKTDLQGMGCDMLQTITLAEKDECRALARDIPVIPIVLDGARVPKPDELPEDIRELAVRNGLDVRHASFHSDMDKLIDQLKGLLKVPDTSQGKRITLREAALRAHEQLRHHDIAIFAEGFTKSEADLLTWYCNRMVMPIDGNPTLVTLHGRQPPSRIIEPIDVGYLSRYDFAEVDDGKESIILQERYGDRRFIDLCLDENEVEAAIAQMKAWPA